MAIDDLVKMLDGMDVDRMRPKRAPDVVDERDEANEAEVLEKQPELSIENAVVHPEDMEPVETLIEAKVDPDKAKLFQDSFNKKLDGKPAVQVEKKKVVAKVDPEMDEEQRRMLEELYSKIG